MSDKHHPSCRPSDRDLVWHCNQCGLNESAEPTAGEWTEDRVASYHYDHDRLAADINAALAAEIENTRLIKTAWDDICIKQARAWFDRDKQLREQLAAEKERSEDALKLYEECVDKLVATQVALKRMQGAAMDELPAEVQRIGDEALAKDEMSDQPKPTGEWTTESLARFFHDTYEMLAPSFGYETREDTKDFNPESKNGRLMVTVCEAVLLRFNAALAAEKDKSGVEGVKIGMGASHILIAENQQLREKVANLERRLQDLKDYHDRERVGK